MIRFLLLLILLVSYGQAEESAPAEVSKPSVWVVTEINWLDFSWTDLGLEQERSFTQPLSESWQKWLLDNQQSGKPIQLCLDQCIQFYSSWQDQESALLMKRPLPEGFAGGMWLKLSFNLRRDKYSGKFRWEGNAVLIDINSKMVILSSELPVEEKSWMGVSQKSLNSQLATRIFKAALPFLQVTAGKLAEDLAYTKVSRLVIRGARQMGDILKLLQEIKTRGDHLGLMVRWDYVQQREARFLFFHRGEEKAFTDLLSQVKELKSSHSYEISHEATGLDHVMNMNAQ